MLYYMEWNKLGNPIFVILALNVLLAATPALHGTLF